MKQITHSNGKTANVQYFGDLNEKLNFATGFIQMYNDQAAKQNAPQINVEVACKKIQKVHDKFYGNCSKYTGQGDLK